jgi:hypothetical protein
MRLLFQPMPPEKGWIKFALFLRIGRPIERISLRAQEMKIKKL